MTGPSLSGLQGTSASAWTSGRLREEALHVLMGRSVVWFKWDARQTVVCGGHSSPAQCTRPVPLSFPARPRERPPSARKRQDVVFPAWYIKQKVHSPIQIALATEWVKHPSATYVRDQTIMTAFILVRIIAAVFKRSMKGCITWKIWKTHKKSRFEYGMCVSLDAGASGCVCSRRKIFSRGIPGRTVFPRDSLTTFKENGKIKIY